MNLSKNELKELVQEAHFEVMLETALKNEMKHIAIFGECVTMIGYGLLAESREIVLNEKAKKKITKTAADYITRALKKNPKLLSVPTAGLTAYGLGRYGIDKLGQGIKWLGTKAGEIIPKALPVAAAAGLGVAGIQALKNKGDIEKTKKQLKKAASKNISRSGKRGAANLKKGAKYVVVKGKEGGKKLVQMTDKQIQKQLNKKKKKNKQDGEQMEIPFESIQNFDKMSIEEMAPWITIGTKALDILNETNEIHTLNESIQGNTDIQNIVSEIDTITEAGLVSSLGSFLATIPAVAKPQQLKQGFHKAKAFVKGDINIMGNPTKKAKAAKETSEPYGIDELEETLRQLKNDKLAESIPRKVTFNEVQRWMGNLEENKFKKTYINDAKRVAWIVNNKLSEDYSTMPASYRRKTEGVSYARERYLAKEFIKHINSKQLDEEV
tara:strand:+ start:1031 stop:2347 length:1317 start_codon:yes stop_codon:yes gene_type:complete